MTRSALLRFPTPVLLTVVATWLSLSGSAAEAAAPAAPASAKSSPDAKAKAKAKARTTAKSRPAVRSDDAPDIVTYGEREDVLRFARELAASSDLDEAWLREQLAQARYQPSVAKAVMPPTAGTAKNWEAYRARFVEPQRIQQGLRWWADNADALERAEARYGVPASIVAAIVGVETFYGRMTGRYKVIDALSTLSFDFPTGRSDRSPFYRQELAAFLRWCRAEGRDPQQVRGSYAGAIGLPQFMPSSILKYAVDFDGDGRIDLDGNGSDVAGSVARYLAEFGWQRGLPTHFAVTPPTDDVQRARLLVPDILPSFNARQLQDAGAVLDEAGAAYAGPLALVLLQNGDNAPSYVAGTQNFYVVTRYNWSSYYALAVIELARSLRTMRPPSTAPSPASAPSPSPAGAASAPAG